MILEIALGIVVGVVILYVAVPLCIYISGAFLIGLLKVVFAPIRWLSRLSAVSGYRKETDRDGPISLWVKRNGRGRKPLAFGVLAAGGTWVILMLIGRSFDCAAVVFSVWGAIVMGLATYSSLKAN